MTYDQVSHGRTGRDGVGRGLRFSPGGNLSIARASGDCHVSAAGDNVPAENGSDFGRGTPMEAGGAGGRAPARKAAGGATLAEELDDEIPF